MGVPESWQKGQAEMEDERQKCREIEAHQGGWRESNLTGTDGGERRDGRQGRSREEDRHHWKCDSCEKHSAKVVSVTKPLVNVQAL